MRTLLHRLICWTIERTQHGRVIGGLRLYNLRYDEDARLADVMLEAAGYLDRADRRFRALVDAEIKMVVASSFQESIYPSTRAYFTRFQRWGGSPLFLASRLVWVAEYIRRARNGSADEAVRRDECTRTQLEFLDSVGEDAAWIASLRKHAD